MVTPDAFFMEDKELPDEDRLLQDAITVPLSSVRVTVQLFMLVVPDLPVIITEQVALPEEKLNESLMGFVSE